MMFRRTVCGASAMVWVDQDRCPPRYHDPVWIAAGGMGDLYRAVDEELDRPVAIKLLAERFAADEVVRSRFRREALAAARLSGEPNTVTIFDVGEWRGTPFIVMEYLGGGTLERALRGGAQPLARSIRWLEQAARSLDVAHGRGVVHRDIKPANLLLDERGCVRVGDFGIATAAGLDSLTLTGTTLGTVGYLAPEQAQGLPVSGATDQYSLAVVAYELLTGTRPFARDSPAAEAAAHINEPVPSAAEGNRALPRRVDATFRKALAKDPAARFASCAAFVSALRSTLERAGSTAAPATLAITPAEQPTRVIARRRRRSPLLAAAVALVVLGAVGLAVALVGGGGNKTPPVAAPTATTTVTTRTTTTTTTTIAAASAGSASLPDNGGASDLNTRGYRLMLAGNYAAALPLLREAVAGLADPANPVTAYANFNLGQTLVQLGQCASAIPYLQRAEELEPTRHEVKDAIRYAEQCAGGGSRGHGHGNGRGNGNGNQND